MEELNKDAAIQLGKALKELRLRKGIKPFDIYKKTWIQSPTLKGIEEGKTNATLKTLFSIANVLGAKIELKEVDEENINK